MIIKIHIVFLSTQSKKSQKYLSKFLTVCDIELNENEIFSFLYDNLFINLKVKIFKK